MSPSIGPTLPLEISVYHLYGPQAIMEVESKGVGLGSDVGPYILLGDLGSIVFRFFFYVNTAGTLCGKCNTRQQCQCAMVTWG